MSILSILDPSTTLGSLLIGVIASGIVSFGAGFFSGKKYEARKYSRNSTANTVGTKNITIQQSNFKKD